MHHRAAQTYRRPDHFPGARHDAIERHAVDLMMEQEVSPFLKDIVVCSGILGGVLDFSAWTDLNFLSRCSVALTRET
jgi:hypothetical protein